MTKARDLYAQAEKACREQGDLRNELFAKFGRLRKDVESGSYLAIRDEMDRDLAREVVQKDSELRLRALTVRGLINLNLNTRSALADWTEVHALATALKDSIWQNRATGQLAIIAGINGDLGAAGVTLLNVISVAGRLGDIAGEVTFTTYLANGMTVNGMADRALSLLDSAIKRADSRRNGDFPTQLYIAKIRALTQLPEERRSQGRAQAKDLIATTLTYAREHDILGAQTEILNHAGLIALEESDYRTAEALLRETVQIADRAHLPRMKAAALLRLSQTFRQTKKATNAATAIERAIEAIQAAEQSYDLPLYIAERAEVQAALGNVRDADALYTQASDLIEGLMVNASSSQMKSSLIGHMGDIYVGHFRFALNHRRDTAQAFRIVETARGRALFDSMRYAMDSTSRFRSNVSEQEIARIQKRLLHDPLGPSKTRRLVMDLEKAYSQLAPTEYARSRDELRMLRQSPVSLDALRRTLGASEAILEFVLDTKSSYCLEITRAGVKVHSIPGRTQIDAVVKDYLRTVKSRADQVVAASNLFARVFAPALSSRPSAITVVPDGSLHLVPIAALTDQNGDPIVKSITVATAPSATVFHMLRSTKARRAATRSFLGVAFSSTPTIITARSPMETGRFESRPPELKPLPHARQEVIQAAEFAGPGAVTLTGHDASESALKAQSLGDFRIIHIAAHAVGNIREPDRAALVLAPGNPNEDGLWQAREIRRTRIAADAVILSACDTGTGRLQGEEGVMNLARTFLVAGAGSVLATLWSVDDRATTALMGRFYKHFHAGRSVAEALRHAQLQILEEFGMNLHPYFWGGFSVIGDGTRRISFDTNGTETRTAGRDIR